MPRTAKGISPIRMRKVMVTQSEAGRRTPSEVPARYSNAIVAAAIT